MSLCVCARACVCARVCVIEDGEQVRPKHLVVCRPNPCQDVPDCTERRQKPYCYALRSHFIYEDDCVFLVSVSFVFFVPNSSDWFLFIRFVDIREVERIKIILISCIHIPPALPPLHSA